MYLLRDEVVPDERANIPTLPRSGIVAPALDSRETVCEQFFKNLILNRHKFFVSLYPMSVSSFKACRRQLK